MKKTILTTIIVAVLICAVLLMTACESKLFPINEERAGKQVTATATYNDRVSIVSVGELYSSFYNYYNYLYTYYSYGYISAEQFQSYLNNLDETFKTTNESLAKSTLYTLKCLDYLEDYYTKTLGADSEKVKAMKAASTKGKTEKDYDFSNMDSLNQYLADRIAEIQAILACHDDYTYYNAAINSANEDLQKLFDDYVSAIRTEKEKAGVVSFTDPEGVTGITLQSKPNRTVYGVNDTLDTTGLVVVASTAKGSVTVPTKRVNIEGFDSSKVAADQTVTVTYQGKTATFKVDIVEDSTVKSITVLEPYRLVYEVGDSFDARGMEVTANLADDKSYIVSANDYVVEGFDSEKAADDQVITVTYQERVATFTVDIVAARPARKTPEKSEDSTVDNSKKAEPFSFTVDEDKILKDENGVAYTGAELDDARLELNIAKGAMTRLLNYLDTNYRSYNDYLYSYCITQVKQLTEDTLAKGITVSEADIVEEYNRLLQEKKTKYANSDYTKSELDDLGSAYLQPKPADGEHGYYYVSQVLFKYTDATNEKVQVFEDMGANASSLAQYKINVAKEIEVWLSNPDYDADAVCEDENCTCPHCKNYNGPRVSYTDINEWYKCVADCPCAACPSHKYLGSTTVNVMTVINDIAASIDAVNAQYADHDSLEYRKALLETINEWIYKANEDDGAVSAITDKKYGYVMTPDKDDSGMVATFAEVCDALASHKTDAFTNDEKTDWAKDGVYVLSAGGGVGSYGWCVSDYGIHFVVLTAYAMEPAYGTISETTVKDTTYQQMGLDYITNVYEYAKGEDGEPDQGTVRYAIGKSLKEEKVAANYAAFQKDFINAEAEDSIKYYPEGYDYMLEQIKGDE